MLHIRTVLVAALAIGCGGSKQTTEAPKEGPPSASPMTTEACTAAGGQVVGDIGDGAIHRPDYVCPTSGEPPLGTIEAIPGQPMGVEGAVCCR